MAEIIATVKAEAAELDRRLRDWWHELTTGFPGRLWVGAVLYLALATLALIVLWFFYLRP